MIVFVLFAGTLGYLLGSLPFGYLVARAKGVNIFEVGSKNPGATNVRRVLGKGPGNLVFALDVLKGAIAASWGLLARTRVTVSFNLEEWGLASQGHIAGPTWYQLGIAGLVGALLGHSFSCFTRFHGGKGVATAAGGFFVVMPLPALLGGLVWAATFYATRYVSLASMFAAVSLPLSAWALGCSGWLIGIAGLVAVFVIIRHRENCRRLLNGTENRFVNKSKNATTA
ncbi:MAG: glycerol-3-phosphate 1-O-acyltransferase PlsY [Opitutaceae bacterium]|nr:glycerol-3-phosphate 1-O-acyltransferase PlsY [Opitutaceae bacterium]